MGDQIVIAIVVVIAIAAHVWLYRWVRFKIDEGAIIQFLKDGSDQPCHGGEAIAAHTNIAVGRVSAICERSREIRRYADGEDTWAL